MGFNETSFLTITAGKYGRELLKKYRKKLSQINTSINSSLPTPDDLAEHCRGLYRDIISGKYSPGSPQEYIVLNKHQGVPRILPVFAFDDALVYYFCVFSIQDELAEGVVQGTFGGWQSSNSIRRKEKPTAPIIDESGSLTYIPYASVNRLAWSEHWKSFQKEAFAASRRLDDPVVVKYDIANFYDSIDLERLGRKLRRQCKSVDDEIVELLMSFLRGWNRRIEGWGPKQMGLPMDVEGEASRLLANFFLQTHDAALSQYVHEELQGEFVRYADDMLILVPDSNSRYRGLVKSGIELHRLGLSVNSGKVAFFDTLEDYDFYWAFDLFHKIGDGKDADSVNTVAEMFFSRLESGESRSWRNDSVLRRLLSVGQGKLNERNRVRVTREATKPHILTNVNEFYLHRINNLLPPDEHCDFISSLYETVEASVYTQQLLHIRTFLSTLPNPLNIGSVNRRIDELTRFYGFHQG